MKLMYQPCDFCTHLDPITAASLWRLKADRLLKVDVESIDFKGTGNQELLKTGTDDWGNDTYVSDGDVTIDYPEWDLGDTGASDDKNEPACYVKGSTINVDVVIDFPASGVIFDLIGTVQGKDYLSFEKTGITSNGQTQTITIDAKEALPQKIDIHEEEIEWEIRLAGTTAEIGTTGPHKVYSVWDDLTQTTGAPTVIRMDWSVSASRGQNGSSSKADAAEAIASHIDSTIGCCPDNFNDTNSWEFLDDGLCGDCVTVSRLAAVGLYTVGIQALYARAWPTADGTNWPGANSSVSPSSCQQVTTEQFTNSQGEQFTGRLGYPGNKFEGFFFINDPNVKAYTIYPVGGPFENQNYYYLEVLDSVASEQYWVDDQLSNRFNDPSTGQLYPSFPVPNVP